MFNIDERLKGLPARRDQVVALYQSINSPHLLVPGKPAGAAQGYIAGIRGPVGFGVFVYLYLAEVADCAVYVHDLRSLTPEQYREVEQEAIAFLESMGFMMDNLNFSTLPVERQEELIRTLPVFQRDPKPTAPVPGADRGRVETPKAPANTALGRLLASF